MTILGKAIGSPSLYRALGVWTRNKQPTSVIATVSGAGEGNVVRFYERSTEIGAAVVDSGGEASTFDLDDGNYTAQEIGTGKAWSIVVSGSTVVVSTISSPGSTGYARFG